MLGLEDTCSNTDLAATVTFTCNGLFFTRSPMPPLRSSSDNLLMRVSDLSKQLREISIWQNHVCQCGKTAQEGGMYRLHRPLHFTLGA
jgi:hypothetical protein